MQNLTGVLIINLGTPLSPHHSDVRRYLTEFLTDERVIDLPWLRRQILVRGFIIPARYRQSAKSYEKIWTAEGSPLLNYGKQVACSLQESLGSAFHVELGMRYQKPGIEEALQRLLAKPLERLLIVPLFPQYASATTGSIHQKVMSLLSKQILIPEVQFIQQFATFSPYIEAICAIARDLPLASYDHILFSYHGLPQRQIKKADKGGDCLSKGCCDSLNTLQRGCYSAQCHATTRAIVKGLGLSEQSFSLCFQSRLGKEPWLQPYASDHIAKLAKEGKKRVLVFSPSFVADCLETLYEIGEEYALEFKQAGGEALDLVPGLNQHPLWIQALKELVMKFV